MYVRNCLLTFSFLFAAACSPNVVSSQCKGCLDGCCDSAGVCQASTPQTCGISGAACVACQSGDACTDGVCVAGTGGGSGGGTGGGSGGGTGGGTGGGDPNAYPPGPYGVSVNRVIQNFTFPGYFTAGSGVKVNTLTKSDTLDLQTFRTAVDGSGAKFRFLLLDISAGWCQPCNQEAQDLGLNGSKKTLIPDWLSRGGLFATILVEGYNESTYGPPVAADLETWANAHSPQATLAIDPTQNLLAQGISPSAFPTNLVIDLRTMKIVGAWYGLDTTYQKWEAALNGP